MPEETQSNSTDDNREEKESNNTDMKINGRMNNLSIPGVDELGIVTEELTGEMQSVESQSNAVFVSSTPIDQPQRTDEKIIAEILKPEERLRLPRNAEKIYKTEKNTAISLD